MSALLYGWDSPDHRTDSWWIRFAPCTREPGTWKEEIYAAARTIANRTTKPIWVCSSGGIDSEIACRAFFDQGIPFSVLTVEHMAGTNEHDIRYARKWCEERGVHQEVVKVDMAEFLSKGIDAYAERYVAVHPFRYFQIKLMEIVEGMGGFAVLCSGEQRYYADLKKPVLTPPDLHLSLSNGNTVPLEWCKDNATDHEPYFHFATPELCLSYIRLPLVSFALANPDIFFRHPANTYTLKRLVYQSVWTDLEVRYKFDGYENLDKALFQATLKRLQARFGAAFIRYDLPMPVFERELTSTLG